MEVTKKSEYAIIALVELALNPDEYTSSKDIAARQNIPANFLPQIIAQMGNRGWVQGVRGPGGGVRLITDPAQITVSDVITLIEGPLAITRCLAGDDGCANIDSCPLHNVWARAQDAMLQVLGDTTIADVVAAKIAINNNKKEAH